MTGCFKPSTTALSITTSFAEGQRVFRTLFQEARSSMIALRPLAPVFLLSANLAIATRAFFLMKALRPQLQKIVETA